MALREQTALELSGKVAIVTGAARGIGAGITSALSEAGAFVVVSDINDAMGISFVAEIERRGGKAMYVRTDISVPADVDNLFRIALESQKRVDILVNNVGIRFRKGILDISDEEWLQVVSTNLNGTFMCTQRAVRLMKNQGSGAIVNITSQAGIFYSKGQGCHYAATKASIIHLTRVLAFELGPLGIRINSIAPGNISVETGSTNITSAIFDRRSPEAIPVGHLGSPNDVAQAVLFLASERSKFITGQTLLVNGGMI